MSLQLTLYDTYRSRIEPFTPLDPQRVTLYVCGPTVYNYIHIGNARPAVLFDTLARLLRLLYPRLLYARNITDIDDKINAAAAAEGVPIRQLAQRYADAYHEDIARLNTLPPDIEPYATDHITPIIHLIQQLLDRGHAYAAEGHILFHVPSYPAYGLLSHRTRDEQIAGARVEVAPFKKDPADFILWKPSSPELPGWDSPWGRGRPGWHIECTAMIHTHLGLPIDIHGGGSDLIFPHHENEIAQGCCATGLSTYARWWLHNGYLTLAGEKMSKSLGNTRTVRELLQTHPSESLRYALLTAHYRKPLEFSSETLPQATRALDRLYTLLQETASLPPAPVHLPTWGQAVALAPEQIDHLTRTHGPLYTPHDPLHGPHPLYRALLVAQPLPSPLPPLGLGAPRPFLEALVDDLNTPAALAHLHQLAAQLRQHPTPERKTALLAAAELLGLLYTGLETWRRDPLPLRETPLTDAEIEALLAERTQARAQRRWDEADAIRAHLQRHGIILEDTPSGTRWRRLPPTAGEPS
ncbi:MAG: cysteine--tRNA ligase [Hydrogenophilus sp.]|nr:cysteine--tRNA ligase [Hydrogenophilus sp.]